RRANSSPNASAPARRFRSCRSCINRAARSPGIRPRPGTWFRHRHATAIQIRHQRANAGAEEDVLMLTNGLRQFRTLFISDVHLGTRGCQAERLLDFLRWHDADLVYLVGDIVDGWALRSGWYWPQSHNDVVQKILRKARKGARVVYVPGNHDEVL